MNNMVALKKLWMKKTIVGLVLGQLLSLLITSTGFSSSELTRRGEVVLLRTSWPGRCRGQFSWIPSTVPKGVSFDYGFLTVTDSKEMDLDIEILVVKAYQYTSITSIMLLDCWSIPSVIFLTWFFLKTKYRLRKAIGVAICVVGLVVVVFSDVHAKDRSGGSNPLKGDLLVIAGSTLYAISNVSEEFFVKSADRVELMAMLGYFGAIISACQINPYRSILERNELKSIHWSAGAVFPFIGFAVAMFLFYSGVPILLKVVMETFGSLKEEIQHRELVIWRLQGFVLLVRMFHHSNEWVHNAKPLFVDLRHVDCFDSHLCIPSEGLYLQSCCIPPQVDWMYFLAFATVAVGLVIYSGGDKEEEQKSADVGDEEVERSKHFDEEAGSVGRRSKTGESSSSSKIDLASTGTAERADNSRVLEKDNTREAI
ncbi:hypothetical protein RHGRI_025774 [Rhododendron griersonianum]|uniref:Solute carrier family 35 member F1 n=1 Tax=Rhododendron griersonianum TaxID=479676 RepID=A0AAV6IVS9_9ERIC|nr:hypothetical protein RHGRI_025774 [Rhododendron griersonianum]